MKLNDKGHRLLKRLRRISGPHVWDWQDRDTVVELIEALIEEVFKEPQPPEPIERGIRRIVVNMMGGRK